MPAATVPQTSPRPSRPALTCVAVWSAKAGVTPTYLEKYASSRHMSYCVT